MSQFKSVVACILVTLSASGCAFGAEAEGEDAETNAETLAAAAPAATRELSLDLPNLAVGEYWTVQINRSGTVRSTRIGRTLPAVGLDERTGIATVAIGATATGLRAFGPGASEDSSAEGRRFSPFRFRFWDLILRMFD